MSRATTGCECAQCVEKRFQEELLAEVKALRAELATSKRPAKAADSDTPMLEALFSDAESISIHWRFDEQQADPVHVNWSLAEAKKELASLMRRASR